MQYATISRPACHACTHAQQVMAHGTHSMTCRAQAMHARTCTPLRTVSTATPLRTSPSASSPAAELPRAIATQGMRERKAEARRSRPAPGVWRGMHGRQEFGGLVLLW